MGERSVTHHEPTAPTEAEERTQHRWLRSHLPRLAYPILQLADTREANGGAFILADGLVMAVRRAGTTSRLRRMSRLYGI